MPLELDESVIQFVPITPNRIILFPPIYKYVSLLYCIFIILHCIMIKNQVVIFFIIKDFITLCMLKGCGKMFCMLIKSTYYYKNVMMKKAWMVNF